MITAGNPELSTGKTQARRRKSPWAWFRSRFKTPDCEHPSIGIGLFFAEFDSTDEHISQF
jgi:hypothetical protein